MIKLENTEVMGWEHAIRGMRNPMNSWEKSDSLFDTYGDEDVYDINGNYFPTPEEMDRPLMIGSNDTNLMKRLVKGGPVHAKFRRMLAVYVDITAPLYWWKEFDTYKVGTVANSCSTMHKIHDKVFSLDDFSCEHLIDEPLVAKEDGEVVQYNMQSIGILEILIGVLNAAREMFLKTNDKKYWWQMIQLLPSSYNQKRTVMLNYEVLAGIYPMRKDHKLDEWHDFCDWIKGLPCSEIITGEFEED